MRIVGPNCIGLANIKDGIWACALSTLKEDPLPKGHAAIVSQSGATGFGPLLTTACDRAVGMKYIITTGNEMDVDLCEMVDYLLDDEDIYSIAAYIEGIKDGEKLIRVAKKAKHLNKTLILQKIGESVVGSRAAASHTASLTGDMAVFNAVVKQFGMLKANDYDELVEMLNISQMRERLNGNRIAVLSHSGGVAGFAGDQLGMHGFEIPVLKEETQKRIDAFLKGFGSPKNPLDLSSHIRRPCIADITMALEDNEEIDGYVFATHGDVAAIENVVNAAKAVRGKPVYFIWTGSFYDEGLAYLKRQGFPVGFSIAKFAGILGRLLRAERVRLEEPVMSQTVLITNGNRVSGYINEADAKTALAKAGVRIPPHRLVREKSELPGALASLDWNGRHVMKIVSDTVIHKSDIGGVLLNLGCVEEAEAGFEKLDAIRRERPGEIKGVLIEEMCGEGLDLVLGVRGDAQFGQVVMLGLGGVYTELFKLVSCKVLPVSRADIQAMIDEIDGLGQLFGGYRGSPGYDREAFVDAVEKVCAFAHANRNTLDLVEVNPLRVMPARGGVTALDCVMKTG
jgi:acyl-CoA synthetase (NDP forming)